MEFFKTPEKQIIKDDSKNSPKKTFEIKKSKKHIIKNIFNEVKPADPLINRKNIAFKPIKYPTVNKPILKLPNFNENTIPYIEKFELINNDKMILDGVNNNNNNKKEFLINHYINMAKNISKLIYAKNPKDKDGNFTIDNIIDLSMISGSKTKRNINNVKFFNIEDNLNKLGISPEDIINFESNFECGNLQLVYLINHQEEELINEENKNSNINTPREINNDINNYELFLQNDTNTRGYSQWFFFRISKGKIGQKIKLNIMNFQRKKTKYSLGLKIWYFSKKKKEEKNIGWHHTKENVNYSKNFLYNFTKAKRTYYYTLSFEYTFEYDNDEVFFANSIPFFYSDVINDLNYFTKKENEKYNFFERKKLCSTLTGNDVDYFNINTDNNLLINDKKDTTNKKGIILFARQHPGETVSSWILKGAYEFLMAFNKEANYLREYYIIKIIPMINVDGVICGNSRTSLSGCDLNRRWEKPDEFLHPEIYYLKELIFNFTKNIEVEYIIDFHGHFGAFNSFFYGNNNKKDLKYCKYFPFVVGKISDVILFNKSYFKMPRFKKGTGRIHLFHELGIENIFTLETSYFGCNQGKYCNQYFNSEILKEIGRDICKGILLCHYNSNIKLSIELKKDILEINKEFEDYLSNFKGKKEEKENNDVEIDKEQEEKEEDKGDISDSESEPSRDNLEEEEIKKLFPFFNKKKIRKITKRKKLNTFLRNNYNNDIKRKKISELKNKIIDIQKNQTIGFPKIEKIFPNPTLRNNKKILTINDKNSNNTKIKNISQDICSKFFYKNKKFKYIHIINNKFPTNINTNNNTLIKLFEEKQTQTEEKFFVFHWTYFFGLYKILTTNVSQKRINIAYPLLIKYDNRIDVIKNSKYKSTSTMVSTSLNKIKLNLKENSIGRNDKKIKYIFKSEDEKNNFINKLIIKNDFTKILMSDNNVANTSRINNSKNKIKIKDKDKEKDKEHSLQKVIASFGNDCTFMKKEEYLKKYLDDENRINSYK